jgi:uncharacterized protein (TIRG00374 family)
VRRNAQLLIGLAVSLLALVLAFSGANLAEVAGALQKANYFALVSGIGLMWLGFYLRALSWRVILGGRVPFRRVFDALNEGYLLNNLLPLRLGELGRAYLISRHTHLTAWQALSSIVVERIVDLVMAVALLFAFLPLVASLDWAQGAAFTAVGLGTAAVITLVVVTRNGERLARLAAGLLRRLPRRPLSPERWQARIESFIAGLAVLRDPRRALQAAFWSGLAWAAAGFGAWSILRAFVPDATATMGFVTLTLVALGAAVPSAPGSAGVFELVTVQTLTAVFGVDRNLALSYALVLHAANILLVTVMGSLALAREGETLADLARAARGMLSTADRADAAAAGTPETLAPKQ